jgi:hypothetical protein
MKPRRMGDQRGSAQQRGTDVEPWLPPGAGGDCRRSVSALGAADASAMLWVGPQLYPTSAQLLPAVKRGCPGGLRRVQVCTRWHVPHSGGPIVHLPCASATLG